VKIFHMSRIINFKNKIWADDCVDAKADFGLRLVQQIVAECVISETGRRGQVDKSRQDVEMASAQRLRWMNCFKRFRAVENEGHRQVFKERVGRTRRNVLLARIMVAGDREDRRSEEHTSELQSRENLV